MYHNVFVFIFVLKLFYLKLILEENQANYYDEYLMCEVIICLYNFFVVDFNVKIYRYNDVCRFVLQ